MNRVEIDALYRDISCFLKKSVTVCGWVRTMRDSKSIAFIELNDGSCFQSVQIVLEEGKLSNFIEITKQNVGAALVVTGEIIETPSARQSFEIHATEIIIEGASTPEYPLQKKRHSAEYLRTIAHLRSRTNMYSAVFRVRSAAAFAIHQFFRENGFIYVHTPIITGSDCEGAGEMFRVTTLSLDHPDRLPNGQIDFSKDFFAKPTSLTVSGQLNGECLAMGLGKIYTFGPTFRAERSYTGRHAAEFWMIEPEMAFADLKDDMRLAESMMKYVLGYILENCPDEIAFFNTFIDKGLTERLQSVLNADFQRVSYTEAVDLLSMHKDRFEYPVYWGCDLQTEHERFLTEEVFQKPLFVIDYPKEIKAFYMRNNDDGKTVAAMDLLVPGVGELIGGSQREERYEVLREKMKAFSLREEDYSWYLDLRRFGSNRHAGFGLGFERLIMVLTGISNIRDVLPFPRTTGCADF